MNRHLAVLAASAAALTAACGRSPKEVKTPTPVRVLAAAPMPATAGLRYSATIQPRQQVDLAFKSGGYVQSILQVAGADGWRRAVQQGDVVARGAVLARVRETDYAQKVSEARASLAEAQAGSERSRLDFERADRLFAAASLTRPEWESSRANADSARARVEAARARLDSAETALSDAALRAPFDGVVLSRTIEEGSLVGQGTVGFSIADTSSVKAVFGVPDRVVAALKPGQRLTVTTEAAPGRPFAGVVTALSPSADRKSRVFDAEVTIPNREGTLRSGLIAAIEVPTEGTAATAALGTHPAIPLSAVIGSPGTGGAYAVFVVTGDGAQSRASSRTVKLGSIAGNLVAVVEGLAAGERVVVSGASLLADGEPVRIVP